MELSTIQLILGVMTVLVGWLGFLEKRLRGIMRDFEERIKEKNELNKLVQEALKEDIAELKVKIDMLISLQIEKNRKL